MDTKAHPAPCLSSREYSSALNTREDRECCSAMQAGAQRGPKAEGTRRKGERRKGERERRKGQGARSKGKGERAKGERYKGKGTRRKEQGKKRKGQVPLTPWNDGTATSAGWQPGRRDSPR